MNYKIKEDDAYILSNIFQSFNSAKEFYSDNYFDYKKIVTTFFRKLSTNKTKAEIYLLDIDYKMKDLRLFLKLFVIFLHDIWREKENKSISFKNETQIMNKLNKVNFPVYRFIEHTNEFVTKINNKINLKLQFYAWVLIMFKDDKNG